MTLLGISSVYGLNTLVRYLSVSRLRLTRNTVARNALAVVKLSRKHYLPEPMFVNVVV
jgi:hypothetical protein